MIDTRQVERALKATKIPELQKRAAAISRQGDRQTAHDLFSYLTFFGGLFLGWIPGLVVGTDGGGILGFLVTWGGLIVAGTAYMFYSARIDSKLIQAIDDGFTAAQTKGIETD